MNFLIIGTVLASAIAQEHIQDPIKDFCRRHQHQTCIIDSKLYIDGGLVYYGHDVQPSRPPQTNTWLIYKDLSNSYPDFPPQYSNLTKSRDVPSVSGGILWPDLVNKVFYQYGGEYTNTTAQSFGTLWFYDTIYNSWNRSAGSGASQAQVSWPAFGAGTTNDEGIGYYYGGYLNENSDSRWKGNPLMLGSIVSYNMSEGTWRNHTYDLTPRAEGSLQYIPAGERGMLVYFGGVERINSATSYQIHLFDLANERWYTQTTTGDIPQPRRGFCAGVVWAADHSSYNIYLFGGIGTNETALEDVWVLSLPSFTWIYWYPKPKATTFAGGKAWTSCDIINRSQMIVMGGYYTNATQPMCDIPKIGGQHGLPLGQEAVERGQTWLGLMSNVTKYRVPKNITDVIGGEYVSAVDGGATLTAPVAGWATPDLSVYFKTTFSAASRSATRPIPTTSSSSSSLPSSPPNSGKTNIGAITGGVIGGVVIIVAVILLAVFCLRIRRKRREQANAQPSLQPVQNDQRTPAEKFVANFSLSQGSALHSPQPSSSLQGSPPAPSDYQQYQESRSQHQQPWVQHGAYAYPPGQQGFQQTYYPPPLDPTQSPRSAYTMSAELPNIQSPMNAELPDGRSPVSVRGNDFRS
ncbi:uncharacterized protein K460DRAFT_425442 [Cucurbitaria berberidis CBS 394.84]|uniref:Galactose oxidase n=1 Tax=Cucurbitaria berberidis CBS 394.84 TaxID=1168544 RepID=A0A9P4GIL7_9PLEO|nr:uncharacterized protein K460DRAFT_425442 [Cucurbitaria berberidis CBS 394.84]KAF1846853.1 hypothetical protein K460DRAFT_425442 [Cucurbitaria berberidis CBS 394.84]